MAHCVVLHHVAHVATKPIEVKFLSWIYAQHLLVTRTTDENYMRDPPQSMCVLAFILYICECVLWTQHQSSNPYREPLYMASKTFPFSGKRVRFSWQLQGPNLSSSTTTQTTLEDTRGGEAGCRFSGTSNTLCTSNKLSECANAW